MATNDRGHARPSVTRCAVPVSDEQLWEMSPRPGSPTGSRRGERVVYFEDEHRRRGARADGRRRRRGPPGAARRPAASSCPPSRPGARGSPAGSHYEECSSTRSTAPPPQGFSGLRITGECGSALLRARRGRPGRRVRARGRPGPARLIRAAAHCCAATTAAASTTPRSSQMRAAARAPSWSAARSTTTTCCGSPRVGPGAARLAGEVDHSNRPQIRTLLETALDQALRSHCAPTDITLDLSSLRFLDVAGAVSLVHAAEEFPSTHRLVLDRRAAAGAARARPLRRPVRRPAGRVRPGAPPRRSTTEPCRADP